MANNPTLVKRFNNDFRAKLVNNWATQLFNAIQGVTSTGTETVLDAIEAGMSGLTSKQKETDRNWKDMHLPLAYILGQNKQAAETALSEFPEEYIRVHTGLFGDIDIDPRKLADGRTGLSKLGHWWYDKNDKVNQWLSKVSGAKAQELHFRYAIIRGVLDQVVRAKSDGKVTLDEANKSDTLTKYVTEQDVKRAVDKALRVTFASEMDTPIGKALKRGYDKLDSVLPVLLNPVTFARFTYTTSRGMVVNPLLFGALDRKSTTGYTSRSVAKGVMAWSAVAIAGQLLSAFGDDDDKWYTLKIGDTTYDVRRWYPASAYFWIAHVIRGIKDGRPLPTGEDILEGIASLETDYFQYGAGMEMLGSIKNAYDTQDASKLGSSSARLIGSYFSGLVRFFKPMKDALAQFDKEEATFRETEDTALSKFGAEMSKSLPGVGRLINNPSTDAVTGEPIVDPFPAGRIFGVKMVHPSFLQPNESVATEWANRLFQFTPTGEWDPDAKKAFFIRRRLLNAVRRGEVKPDDLDTRIDQLVKDGKLTEKSAGTLRKDLKLSELQYKLKYAYKPGKEKRNPAMDKKLDKVLSKATEAEKKEINDVVGNRMKD
jgi:hypothetical protein